ncbi:MAG TPA: preprotein translocase subunit SecG [Alphaproteobacteria bacterium]|jgi:preprotein translocase subunit SecG
MTTLLLVIHIFLALALVVTVLLQRSEGGALGIGGGNNNGMMSGRAQANFLTRATGIIAGLFMLNCLVLAILAGANRQPRSIFDQLPATAPLPSSTAPAPVAPPMAPSTPGSAPTAPAPTAPPTR